MSSGVPESGKVRLAGLDALRGIAAFMVVLYHFTTDYQRNFGHTPALPMHFPLGRYGVELFFMISGFVISMTLDRTRSIGAFAFARFSRLFPAYWCSVATTFVVVSAFGLPGWDVNIVTAAINLTMLQEFFGVRHIEGVYWTLHAELGFYFLIAALYWMGLRRHLIPIFVALVLFEGVANFFEWRKTVPGLWRLYLLIPLKHLGLFLIGIIIYESRKAWKWAYLPALLACVVVESAPYGTTSFFMITMCAALVFVATRWNAKIWSAFPPLLFLGDISYSLYLMHAAIGFAIIWRLEQSAVSPVAAVVVAVAAALALATANTFLVEKPAMKSLRNWYRTRRHRTIPQRDVP